jgi:hypothetical protein
MKIYQPMMFVGLGGTGCQVGTELERRLREELCGPDGTALTELNKARFQLPDCLQFVYADYSETELHQLPHLSAPPPLRAAYGRTSRAAHDLLPDFQSSPQMTQRLRMAMHDEVATWLPSDQREPRVVPLSNGAGQFPTVGRAALFATLQRSLEPVLGPLQDAIDAIAKSGADLRRLGGRPIRGCDVFVAFSVAGGTGAGIFYDYLHLIGQAFGNASLRVRIYPLVVMPSAFPIGKGGGRAAELNAGRAVIDLFRLVDDQNVPKVSNEIGQPGDDGPLAVRYPGNRRIVLPSGTVQTAFLFNRTAGIRPEDLRRSIVSLVLSLVGTELAAEGPVVSTEKHQSFADSFVNSGHERAARSPSGIGHKGVSTSLVASMTVPVNELAELLAGRLLATAVRRLTDPARRARENNSRLVARMFAESGIEPVWIRDPLPPPADPQPLPRGGADILAALSNRAEDMGRLHGALNRRLERETPELARQFAPRRAVLTMLKADDLFRLSRAVNGQRGQDAGPDSEREIDDPITRAGFVGMLNNRRNQPAKPPGMSKEPPRANSIRRRLLGTRTPRWGDPEVVAALREQDTWYRWQSREVWHRNWKAEEPRWRPATDVFVAELGRIVDSFKAFEATQRAVFVERTRELYRDRTGVSYLLPPQGNLADFYRDVMDRLARDIGLPENEDEAGLVLEIVDPADWQEAYKIGCREPGAAVSSVKNVLEQRIKTLFTEHGSAGERPLLPSLADLLTSAAGDEQEASAVSRPALEQFGSQLANLLPGGFTPEGTGPLKILISYPRVSAQDKAEDYLRRELLLPQDAATKPDFRPVSGLDSITVVLFRSTMSLSEVPEVRGVLQTWARALRHEDQEDYLAWRQRTGFDDDWLASTRRDREHILHRLLCAMWNDQIEILDGDDESPTRIRLLLAGGARGTASLPLEAYDQDVSSWASILHAYENWTLLADDPRVTETFSGKLMDARPRGYDRSPERPSALYRAFVHEIAPAQIEVLDDLSERLGDVADAWIEPLREFWEQTVRAALTMPFPNATKPIRKNLVELEESTRPRSRRRAQVVGADETGRDERRRSGWDDPTWTDDTDRRSGRGPSEPTGRHEETGRRFRPDRPDGPGGRSEDRYDRSDAGEDLDRDEHLPPTGDRSTGWDDWDDEPVRPDPQPDTARGGGTRAGEDHSPGASDWDDDRDSPAAAWSEPTGQDRPEWTDRPVHRNGSAAHAGSGDTVEDRRDPVEPSGGTAYDWDDWGPTTDGADSGAARHRFEGEW